MSRAPACESPCNRFISIFLLNTVCGLHISVDGRLTGAVVKNPLSPAEHPGGVGVNNELFEESLEQFVVCAEIICLNCFLHPTDSGTVLVPATERLVPPPHRIFTRIWPSAVTTAQIINVYSRSA